MVLLNASEALIEALELEAKAAVINDHEVEDGGVQVVDVDGGRC